MAHGDAPHRARRRSDPQGLLVAVENLFPHARPREALGPLARGEGHPRAQPLIERQAAQRLGQRERVPRWEQQALAPVAQHLAVAGDVGGEHGGGRCERLGQHHPEALAAERGRAQHLGTGELRELALLAHLPERVHAAVVEHHVGDLLGAGADERERGRDLIAQRLEGPQQHRQALAFDRLTDEEDPQLTLRRVSFCVGVPLARARVRGRAGERAGRLRERARRGHVNPVGDDAVAPPVEAPRGPGGGLGDGDPRVQAVHPPAPAERERGDSVRELVLGVGVEGPTSAGSRVLASASQQTIGTTGSWMCATS